MLQPLQVLTSELLNIGLCIGLHLTGSTHAVGCALSREQSIAQVIVTIVYQIRLEACLHQFFHIHRHKSQIGTELVTTLPFLRFRTEGDRFVGRLNLFLLRLLILHFSYL